MTTTTTISLHEADPRRLRRYMAATLAAAAFLATATIVANRAIDDDLPRSVAPVTSQEAADIAMVNDAIHVFTAPEVVPAVASPELQLVINEEARLACASGMTDICPFTHTWIEVGGASSPVGNP